MMYRTLGDFLADKAKAPPNTRSRLMIFFINKGLNEGGNLNLAKELVVGFTTGNQVGH